MHNRLVNGMKGGLMAGVMVALAVLAYDVFLLRPFSTPTQLGLSLLGGFEGGLGAETLGWFERSLRNVYALIAFSLVHLGAFALLGLAAACTLRPDRVPANVWTGALLGIVLGTVVFYAGQWLIAPPGIDLPPWQLVLLVNGLAGVVLAAYLVEPEPTVDAFDTTPNDAAETG